jgi:hypothetical protein
VLLLLLVLAVCEATGETVVDRGPSRSTFAGMDAAAYKQQKEAFVSGLHGTFVAELLLLICPLPAGNVNMT